MNRFSDQHISHPIVSRKLGHPESLHTFNKSRAVNFARQERRRNRAVTCSVSFHRSEGGRTFTQFHVVSEPKVDKVLSFARSAIG